MISEGRSYTLKQLRDAYRASEKVFRAWLRPCMVKLYAEGYEPGQRLLTPNQVKVILAQLGYPEQLKPH